MLNQDNSGGLPFPFTWPSIKSKYSHLFLSECACSTVKFFLKDSIHFPHLLGEGRLPSGEFLGDPKILGSSYQDQSADTAFLLASPLKWGTITCSQVNMHMSFSFFFYRLQYIFLIGYQLVSSVLGLRKNQDLTHC